MEKKTLNYDVCIIGAGAAGLMCAIESAKRGRKTCIIEHNGAIGRKIRISGGGRCNFTNIYARPENYISENPHFCKSALSRYTPNDFLKLVQKYKIKYHEKKLGQLFCNDSSQQIIDLLKKECDLNNVKIYLNTTCKKIDHKNLFLIKTNKSVIHSEKLVIACGGLSIPPLGATDFGYKVARLFGHNIISPRAALVPFTLNQKDLNKLKGLSGISIDTETRFKKIKFRENILITHRGLSGPAILQISSYWEDKKPIAMNLLPQENVNTLFSKARKTKTTLKNFLAKYLTKRFAEKFTQNFLSNKPLNEYTDDEINHIITTLENWQITPNGTEGYKKAEVTVGGVDTKELSSQTMESKKQAGLYFIGEVVDVTGHLGGYNFQWAWASGYACGQSA